MNTNLPNRDLRTPATPTPPKQEDKKSKLVEQGMQAYQEACFERDRLREALSKAERDIAQNKVEMNAMFAQITDSDSRVKSYQMERDKAIAERAKYEALFISIQGLLKAFSVPAIPLVKELADEIEAQEEINTEIRKPVDLDESMASLIPRRNP